jgi:hypothetical protein
MNFIIKYIIYKNNINKMKYLKKFENFNGQDLGRFSDEEETVNSAKPIHDEEEENIFSSEEEEDEMISKKSSEEECEPCKDDEEEEEKNWGDEDLSNPVVQTVERFAGFLEAKKAKPDFLDLDKDGNKKESMKKAAKDAKSGKEDKKEDKKEEKETKGLSKAQKKLPLALQKAIAAKKK